MEEVLVKTQFKCSHCGGDSKIPIAKANGLYKVTCFYCKEKSMIEIIDGIYSLAEKNLEKNQLHLENAKIEIINPATLSKPIKYKAIEFADFYPWLKKIFRFKFLHKKIWSIAIAIVGTIIFLYLVIGIYRQKDFIQYSLNKLEKNQPIVILDRNHNRLSEIFQKKISNYHLQEYPPQLLKTVIGIEDRKFFKHYGIDIIAVLRAFTVNIASFGIKQGASTITQQLARIILDDRSRNMFRKLRELQVAFALEMMYSKDEILNKYLNLVYLGHGAFGYAEAAKFYFNKDIKFLSEEEFIVLASIAASPNKYSPIKNSFYSYERVLAIAKELQKSGYMQIFKLSDVDQLYRLFGIRSPHETVFGNRNDSAPWVTEHVRQIIISLFPDNDLYQSGGLVIETTLNAEIQLILENMVESHLRKEVKSGVIKKTRVLPASSSGEENSDHPKNQISLADKLNSAAQDYALMLEINSGIAIENENESVQAAVVGMNPMTGEILFLHGGREFKSGNQFNRALQMQRQTGSTIKAILYSAAIEEGVMKASSRVIDAPLFFKDDKSTWTPKNTGGSYDGEISLREALTKSKNSAAVQVAESLGSMRMDEYFTRFFFPDRKEREKRFRNDLSLALGSLEMSPLEMNLAYSAFANDGKIVRPHLIKKISTADGKVLFQPDNFDEFKLNIPQTRKVIQADTAEVMTSMLHDSAEASGLRKSGYHGLAYGKTGTTNDNRDAWFIGFRPGLVATAWIGFDNQEYSMGPGAFGGTIASELWGKIFREIDQKKIIKELAFKFSARAEKITICTESGLAAIPSCPHQKVELFVKKFPERKTCNLNHSGQTIKSIF